MKIVDTKLEFTGESFPWISMQINALFKEKGKPLKYFNCGYTSSWKKLQF